VGRERVAKGAGGATTHYHYDRAGRLIAESDGSGQATREYIQLAGLPLALVVDIATTPALQYVHADRLGTPRLMTDGSQAVVWDGAFTPFGLEDGITGTGSNDQRFPGQLLDGETGYHYNYFRTYDPGLGRYLQSDPIGLAGGLNRYAYVEGNPVNLVDPLGLESLLGGGGIGANPENASARDVAIATGMTLAPLAIPAAGVEAAAMCRVAAGAVARALKELAKDETGAKSFKQTGSKDGHKKNKRPSTRAKHEKGDARRQQDQGKAEKGDQRRPY